MNRKMATVNISEDMKFIKLGIQIENKNCLSKAR